MKILIKEKTTEISFTASSINNVSVRLKGLGQCIKILYINFEEDVLVFITLKCIFIRNKITFFYNQCRFLIFYYLFIFSYKSS